MVLRRFASDGVYPFAPASYNTGLVVNRTWTLSGDHGQELQATVTLANGLSGPLSGAFDEVIPKTVAGLDSAVEFNPLPDQVVQSDPVVRFKYYLTRARSPTFTTPSTSARRQVRSIHGWSGSPTIRRPRRRPI